jgi:hypothetical protein
VSAQGAEIERSARLHEDGVANPADPAPEGSFALLRGLRPNPAFAGRGGDASLAQAPSSKDFPGAQSRRAERFEGACGAAQRGRLAFTALACVA